MRILILFAVALVASVGRADNRPMGTFIESHCTTAIHGSPSSKVAEFSKICRGDVKGMFEAFVLYKKDGSSEVYKILHKDVMTKTESAVWQSVLLGYLGNLKEDAKFVGVRTTFSPVRGQHSFWPAKQEFGTLNFQTVSGAHIWTGPLQLVQAQ